MEVMMQDNTIPTDEVPDFSGRPPSTEWESVTLAGSREHFVWVWFKPANVPQGLVLRIPDETYRDYPHPERLTIRKLLQIAGVEPSSVSIWHLCGVTCEGQNGTSPALDQPIPEPAAGVDPNIVVYINAPPFETTQQAPPSRPVEERHALEVFLSIDRDWNASLQIEQQLTALRKQLANMLGRLTTLNRDLTPEESNAADTLDRKAWQDARRWLRDGAATVSRYITEFDVGEALSAAKENWLAQVYQQFVVPRQPFDGMQQTAREFEAHRKTLQTLQISMNTALSSAAQDGERRAQQVLSRIAAKMRAARSKR
jgi:hypothetical protein